MTKGEFEWLPLLSSSSFSLSPLAPLFVPHRPPTIIGREAGIPGVGEREKGVFERREEKKSSRDLERERREGKSESIATDCAIEYMIRRGEGRGGKGGVSKPEIKNTNISASDSTTVAHLTIRILCLPVLIIRDKEPTPTVTSH